MKSIRRLAYVALAVAYTHLVFGAIVRISGSGMGCGDNWPKCYGHWFPPLDQPTLVVEWTHRLLAALLLVALVSLAIGAWRRRDEPGVRGAGGVLALAGTAPLLWFAPALLGAVTVFLGNPPYATAAHWMVAMLMVAVITAIAVRAGALGGDRARVERLTKKGARTATFAAVLAFIAVTMGGLTAKVPFGSVACTSFPLCGTNAAAPASAVQIQLTHRIFATFLLLQLIGAVVAMRGRDEAPVVRRAAWTALVFAVAQFVVAASMVLLHLPPVLRSLHEAVGVLLWISCFTFAYLARRASRVMPEPAAVAPHTTPAVAAPSTATVTSPAHSMAVIVARGADL
jgi:heme a synthase